MYEGYGFAMKMIPCIPLIFLVVLLLFVSASTASRPEVGMDFLPNTPKLSSSKSERSSWTTFGSPQHNIPQLVSLKPPVV
jgi:hypothetical protein